MTSNELGHKCPSRSFPMQSQGICLLYTSISTTPFCHLPFWYQTHSPAYRFFPQHLVLAIGVTPDTVLAKEAGLELGIKECIVVNDRMETSVPVSYTHLDVYKRQILRRGWNLQSTEKRAVQSACLQSEILNSLALHWEGTEKAYICLLYTSLMLGTCYIIHDSGVSVNH